MIKHDNIEKSLPLMVVMIVIALSWGGMAEIVPLFWHNDTNKPVEGLEPYTAMQLEGRDIYIREGCHVCHTQMVRPFRAQTAHVVNIHGIYRLVTTVPRCCK